MDSNAGQAHGRIFSACFADMEDPRDDNARHDLLELLVIALCAVLCGAEDCSDMALFGRGERGVLPRVLTLRHGVPSHDTFSRVFRLIDPVKFHACFLVFMRKFSETIQGVIAIDGKTLRRSFDRASKKSALHLVSAWAAVSAACAWPSPPWMANPMRSRLFR